MIFSKRSQRLHRWVPLVLNSTDISFKWNARVLRIFTSSTWWSLCLKAHYHFRIMIFVCMCSIHFLRCLSLSSFSFIFVQHHVCVCVCPRPVKCNLMLICVASYISKSAKMTTHFILEAIFPLNLCCGISWKTARNEQNWIFLYIHIFYDLMH